MSVVIILGLTFLPFILVWWQPFIWSYALVSLIVVNALVWWWYRSGSHNLPSWLISGSTFTIWQLSFFCWWFFLEGLPWRVIFLTLLAVICFWYLWEWQRIAKKLTASEVGAGAGPTLVVSFMAILALVSSAQFLLILFDWPVWLLLLVFFIPQVWLYAAWLQSNGWSLLAKWRIWLFGTVILLEIFSLVLWWPSGPAVAGFVSALTYLAITATVRQETQGFVNVRTFRQEIVLVLLLLVLVLLSARWL